MLNPADLRIDACIAVCEQSVGHPSAELKIIYLRPVDLSNGGKHLKLALSTQCPCVN